MILLLAYCLVAILASTCVVRAVGPGRWFTPLFCLVAGALWPLIIAAFFLTREGDA